MRMARNGPWIDFGMCLCVGTVIERALVRSMGSSASSSSPRSSGNLLTEPHVVGLDAPTAFPFRLSFCRIRASDCEACGVWGQNCCGWVAVGCPLGGVRRGVGGVRGVRGEVRKGVSVIAECTSEHIVASAGPVGSTCK